MSHQKLDLKLIYRGGANLYITNLCNGSCSYCCLKEWKTSESEKAEYMSLKNLDKLILWLKESNLEFVQLIGGEPMLHPKIVDFVKRLKTCGINIKTILSNGLADTELYKIISKEVDTTWLINVNHPTMYSIEQWEKLNRNLKLLMWKGEDKLIIDEPFDKRSLSLQLAINFYKPDMDYRYIIDLAKKYRCSHIRYAPSHPSSGMTNEYISFDKLLEIKPAIMSFLKDAVCEGIKPGLECVLPPCIFTTSEWKYLILFTEALKTICPPDLEVMPDMTVECCVSMMGILPHYKVGIMSALEMIQGFIKENQKYRDAMLPQCKNCKIFNAKGCQGYCLRFKKDYVKKGWRSLFN